MMNNNYEDPDNDKQEATIWSFKHFTRFLPFKAVFNFAVKMNSAFITAYGAAWFAGCRTIKQNNHCHKQLDYVSYNFYHSMSASVSGLFSFLCAGFIGHASDIYGRKLFLSLYMISEWLPYIGILISNNMYLFLGLSPLASLFSGAIVTYIGYSLPTHKRLVGYGISSSIKLVSQLLGTLCAFGISYFVNDYFNFYVVNAFFFINMIYLTMFVKEAKDNKNTQDLCKATHHRNLFCSFKYICSNSVVLWITLSSTFISFPTVGLINIALVIFSDEFASDSQSTANTIAIIWVSGSSLGSIATTLTLPMLKKHMSEYKILLMLISLIAANSVLLWLVSLSKQIYLLPFVAFMCGIGRLVFSVYNSILPQFCNPNEIGIALGTLISFNSLVHIAAPFGFAICYRYLKQLGIQSAIFLVGALLGLIGLLLCIPLRTAMKNQSTKSIDVRKRVPVSFEPLAEPLIVRKHIT